MALRDLTPQLRTRLSRLERVAGLFVLLATALMLFGLGYYVYNTAKRKGWFLNKAPYFTYLNSGGGIRVGDPVKLMGFDVGEITRITAEDPAKPYNVYVEFVLRQPFYGYVWSDSTVKVKSAGLLGSRYLEVTKGGTSGSTNKLYPTYVEKDGTLVEIYTGRPGVFTNYSDQIFFVQADEPPDLSSQMDAMVQSVKEALPNFMAMTNQFRTVLDNLALAVGQLDQMLTNAQPLITNLTVISANLRNPRGSLGDWLLPTNVSARLDETLASAHATLLSANTAVTNTDERLGELSADLERTLENLANITSNLHAQVQANTNMLTGLSELVIHTDDLVQGLKRHWLLRSAFKKKDEPTPAKSSVPKPRVPPKFPR